MSNKEIDGRPYHLWNPYTDLEYFLSFLGLGSSVINRGQGAYLYNPRGDRFLNVNSAVWNVGLGLGREELVQAAEEQMRELAFVGCWSMAHPKALEFAAKLVQITGGHYDKVYLGANGSEAVETALKMARQYQAQSPDTADRGRYKIISLRGCYHGFSYGAVSTSGLIKDEADFGPLLPGYKQIEPPYCYRCPYGENGYPGCGLKCAAALAETIEREGAESVAAFIMEPVMGEYSVVVPPDEYYQRVGEICRRYGLLFIVDEVTTGFGRTGKLFASEAWAPRPDILCLGKTISSGYVPLSATLATESVYARFKGAENYFRHGSTHSGHPVSAAVGLAAVKIIIEEKLPENAAQTGAYLKSRLEALMDKHEIIGDVRGKGLMIALELVRDRGSKEPLSDEQTLDLGLDAIVRGMWLSISKNNFRLLPPLIIDEAFADEVVEILDGALSTGFTGGIGRKARLAKEFMRAKLTR
jgi:adenosylmethionine-8-amino-7-oxononanoate aminotransferase